MKIIVDFRIKKDFSPGIATFFEQLWVSLAVGHPASKFLLLANDDVMPDELPENMSVRICKRKGITWLQKNKLPGILNECGADRYVTLQEEGLSIVAPANNHFVKNDLVKPTTRLLFCEFYKSCLQVAATDSEDIKIVKPALEAIAEPVSWAEAESIKTQYSGGRDFFLFTGDIEEKHQLIALLKAFSIFKKWQQSNMQLVIAGYCVEWTSWFEEKLFTYKYKQDVLLLKNISFSAIAKLTAVSYAVLYPGTAKVPPLALIFAIQTGTAFVATDNEVNRQFTDAALWVDKNNPEEGFGNAMILLYKDENQKQILIQKAKQETKHFSRQRMLKKIWECIKQK
jgi:glycosyltransferase involved in cell wall biosynthesis